MKTRKQDRAVENKQEICFEWMEKRLPFSAIQTGLGLYKFMCKNVSNKP